MEGPRRLAGDRKAGAEFCRKRREEQGAWVLVQQWPVLWMAALRECTWVH